MRPHASMIAAGRAHRATASLPSRQKSWPPRSTPLTAGGTEPDSPGTNEATIAAPTLIADGTVDRLDPTANGHTPRPQPVASGGAPAAIASLLPSTSGTQRRQAGATGDSQQREPGRACGRLVLPWNP